MNFWLAAAGFGCVVAAGCVDHAKTAKETALTLQIISPAFAAGQPIPDNYTCAGLNVSPPLTWTNPPAGAKSSALIADDPDAPGGTWVHWVIYNLPPATAGLSEGVPKSPELANGAKQGVNDYQRTGYGGPCPPPGKPHRYFFKLYALDLPPDLKSGLTKKDLVAAMDGHILAEGQLMGTYQRK